jgi:hypothetical protein
LPPAFKLLSCLTYSSTLQKKATSSSEMSFDFQQTIRHNVPVDRTLHNHLCENLNSYAD